MRRVALIVFVMVTLVGCASRQAQNDVELTIADSSLELRLSREIVLTMLGESLETSLDCDGDLDEDVRALLEPLAHSHRRTTELRGGDERVVARRRGSSLRFTISGEDGGRLEATMPWAVGECLLGRRTTLEAAIGSRPIQVRLTTASGKTVTAMVR